MSYRIWYSTESFADYIITNTNLQGKNVTKKKMYESDANNPRNFHAMPDHIKQILYLDAPDLIIEMNGEPIFSIEVSTEAGTGHNAFQRFARLAASVENNVPAFYIYPEAAIITRENSLPKWDKINPLILKALDDVMSIYGIPALLYYFSSDYRTHADAQQSPNIKNKGLRFEKDFIYAGSPDSNFDEMQLMFSAINEITKVFEQHGVVKGRDKLLQNLIIRQRRSLMNAEYTSKGGNLNMSPLSATVKIPTEYVLNYLSQYENKNYQIGELLRNRKETVIYRIDASFRGDPYPGAFSAIDYLMCREGKSFEERKHNLIMAWGNLTVDDNNKTLVLESNKSTIHDFIKAVKASEDKNILGKNHQDIKNFEIPRYFMQVRYGSTFSKVKHIRVYSYFADAILFPDGALWRDA
jgi:hypothetical protein